MSRSVRNTKAGGMHKGLTSARSEAFDKQLWHRALRAAYRKDISEASADSDVLAISRYAVSNMWRMAKDGHLFWSNQVQKTMALSRATRIVGDQGEHEVLKLAARRRHQLLAK